MAKTLPYFRFYPADADTDEFYSSLTDQQLGFFHRCLNRAWLNGGLPADLNQLAATLRCMRQYLDKLWPVVGAAFQPNPENPARLINRRQEEERSLILDHAEGGAKRARDYRDRKRMKTKNSDSERHGDVTRDASRFASLRAYESISVSEFESSKHKNNVKPQEQLGSEFARSRDATWEWFQAEYPTEVNPFVDGRLFVSVIETEQDIADLRANLPKWKASERWQEGYVKTAQKFLSERCFRVVPRDVKRKKRDEDDYVDPYIQCDGWDENGRPIIRKNGSH